jgi:hypothetical protein
VQLLVLFPVNEPTVGTKEKRVNVQYEIYYFYEIINFRALDLPDDE